MKQLERETLRTVDELITPLKPHLEIYDFEINSMPTLKLKSMPGLSDLDNIKKFYKKYSIANFEELECLLESGNLSALSERLEYLLYEYLMIENGGE